MPNPTESPLRKFNEEQNPLEGLSMSPGLTPLQAYEARGEGQFTKGLRGTALSLLAGHYAEQGLKKRLNGDPSYVQDEEQAKRIAQEASEFFSPRVTLRNVGSLSDLASVAAYNLGGAVASMTPTVGAALLTRKLGPVGSYAGAFVPSYAMEKGEAALDQLLDPELSKAPAYIREQAATAKGGVNALLDAIVPSGIAHGFKRAPKTLLGGIGRAGAEEALTETAQEAVGYAAKKAIDQKQELDPWDLAEAGFAGLVGGGGIHTAVNGPAKALSKTGELISNAVQSTKEDIKEGIVDPIDRTIQETAQKTKEGLNEYIVNPVDEVISKMAEAAKVAAKPIDVIKNVFSNGIEEDAAADLTDTPAEHLKGATLEETAANVAKDNEIRAARAARYADELLNDQTTPDSIKQKIVEFNGNFSDPNTQKFLARALIEQRKTSKFEPIIKDIIDSSTNEDWTTKKNLQEATPSENAAFTKTIFEHLTDEAKADPTVRKHISDVANAIMAFAAKTGDVSPKDIPMLMKMSDALSMFKDPDALVKDIATYANLPRPEDSFLSKIKRITNAQQDIKRPNSFLVYSLTPEAKRELTTTQLNRVAQLIDTFTLTDQEDPKRADAIINGLAPIFGSPDHAKAVIDYYSRLNKPNLKLDIEEGDNAQDLAINEIEAPKAEYRFKDARSLRPFHYEEADKVVENISKERGAKVERVPYSKYVEERNLDPETEYKRILADIDQRIEEHKKHKGEDRSVQINALTHERERLQETYNMGLAFYKDPKQAAKRAIDAYEVLKVSDAKQDTSATDEDIKKFRTLVNVPDAKDTRIVFQKKDGSKLTLSAESMWKTQGDKEGPGGGESAVKRMHRLFADAVASVLARDDIEKLVTPLNKVVIDRATGRMAEYKPDPDYLRKVRKALDSAKDHLEELNKRLDEVLNEYRELLDDESLESIERREAIKEVMQRNIDRLQTKLDSLPKSEETQKERIILKEKLRMYKDALSNVNGMEYEFYYDRTNDEAESHSEQSEDGVYMNRKLANLRRSQIEDKYDRGPRYYEEDTGLPVGAIGAGKSVKKLTGLDRKAVVKKILDNMWKLVHEGRAVERSGIFYIKDPNATRNLAGRITNDQYFINYGQIKEGKFANFMTSTEENRKALEGLGISAEQLAEILGNDRRIGSFVRDYIQSNSRLLGSKAIESLLTANERDKVKELAKRNGSKKSSMNPNPNGKSNIDMKKIIDEIERIRGKDVEVIFTTFANINASGEYKINKDKTKRIIKIAIDAMDPMSVAWHESLHDFFAMLDKSKEERKIKADLVAAASAPQVMKKLRELLKNHQEALKQIEEDEEERLAYAYQFWAEGALVLGKTGNSLFSRVMKFFRDLLGVVTQEEKLDRIFSSLHRGELSEPSIAAVVIKELRAQTLSDRIKAASGPVGELAERIFLSSTEQLRKMNVPALTELADMFLREPGRQKGGELPFIQRRAQMTGKYMNKLQKILEGTTAVERRRALEHLQAMKAPSTPLEKAIAEFLDEMHKYMVNNGVKQFDPKTKKWVAFGYVGNYFPRVWDKETIRENEEEFIDLLSKYIDRRQAINTFNAIVNGDGSLELAESERHIGFTPWMPNVLDRRFTFINPSNAKEFAKYQSKDLVEILSTYVQRAVHRAEYAKSFGNDGEVIKEKLLEAKKQGATLKELMRASKIIQGMEGTLGHDFNPAHRQAMNAIITLENIALLPLSLFSNLVDPLGIAVRSNDIKDAFEAYKMGLKGLLDQIRGKKDGEEVELAKMLGIIDEQNMLEALGSVYNSMYMSKTLKNINTMFFKLNGMERWNRQIRVAASVAAQRFIAKNKDNERYMKELGITKDDVFELKDGRIALTKDELLSAGAEKAKVDDIEKRIQAAVFKWVDDAVIRPNAAHRPLWGNDPRFMLIFHLKQFTYSFNNSILKRAIHEIKHDNMAPAVALALHIPVMFVSGITKGILTGRVDLEHLDLYAEILKAINRSGILGSFSFVADAVEDLSHRQLPGYSFLGPAFDHFMTVLKGLTGQASLDQVLDRTIPLKKYF